MLGPLQGPTQQNRGSWFRHIRCARAASHISANDAGRHACRRCSICHRRTTRIIPRDWPRGGRRGGMDHPHAAHPPLDRQRLGRRWHRRRRTTIAEGNDDGTLTGGGRRKCGRGARRRSTSSIVFDDGLWRVRAIELPWGSISSFPSGASHRASRSHPPYRPRYRYRRAGLIRRRGSRCDRTRPARSSSSCCHCS